jgi:hypothetical protein
VLSFFLPFRNRSGLGGGDDVGDLASVGSGAAVWAEFIILNFKDF